MLALALVACLFVGVAAAIAIERRRDDADLRRRWNDRPTKQEPSPRGAEMAAYLTYASPVDPPSPIYCPRCAARVIEAYGNASSTSLWWRCGACGHVWATISRHT